MGVKAKIMLCACLTLLAAVSLALVLGDLGVLPVSAASEEQSVYLVREYEGYVGVFYPAQAQTPIHCTDISVKDLPLSDRVELAAGIGFSDYSQVVRLLEDLGS